MAPTSAPLLAPHRKPRWTPTDQQKGILETVFAADSFPSFALRKQLAEQLAIEPRQVQIWFQNRRQRERKEGGLISEISEMRLKAGNDVEALTSLYRKIFNYLVVRAGLEPGADRPAEREIAAALESVFPRIGLKAFTALPMDDKVAQLHELANIVLGIRLFNRHIGKGGAGMVDLQCSLDTHNVAMTGFI